MILRKSLRSREVVTADDTTVCQSNTDTVVSAKRKSSDKSTDSEVHLKRFSTRLWSLLRGSKHDSSSASTVPIVGPTSGIEHAEHIPEQRSSLSLFGPVNVETEQNVQPQQTVVCKNQFGATRDALRSDRHLQDSGNHHSQNGRANRGWQHSGVPPNGGPTHGGHLQDGGFGDGGSIASGVAIGGSLHGGDRQWR